VAWGGAEGEDETRGGAFAEGVDDVVLQGSFAVWAVEALADDDQNPPLAVLLALSNEAVHFALGLSCGVAVEIALCFDLEPWVLEHIHDARVRGVAPSDHDPIAFALNE
jgi:hypothetical protein